MTFTRLQVFQEMKRTKIVPLFYNADVNQSKAILKACYDGGVRVVEFTNRGKFAHEIFVELRKYSYEYLKELKLGIGSVTDAGTASLYMQLGADFIVTPVMREDIAIVCNRRKVLFVPGCGSLNEICRAEELGCEIVKLFPGSTYGASFIKAIKGPQPWTEIMVTGGVSPDKESLNEWLGAGATCVGIGSNLISGDFSNQDQIENLTKKVIEIMTIATR